MAAWAVKLPTEEIVMSPSGVMPPRAELRRIFPVPQANVRSLVPSIVPLKRMLPDPEPVSNPPSASRVMGLENEIVWLVVVIVPAKKTGPVPFCV